MATNGEVMSVAFDSLAANPRHPGVTFKKVGIKKATTFKGLCNQHDQSLFKPIDNFEFTDTSEQKIALTIRALIYKKYTDEHTAQMLLNTTFPLQGIDKDVVAKSFAKNAQNMQQIINSVVQNFERKDYEITTGFYVRIAKPCLVAVTTCFGLEFDFKSQIYDINAPEKAIKFMTLTIFPQNNDIYVVFTWLAADNDVFMKFKEDMLELSEAEQTAAITNIVIKYTDNLVIGIKTWEMFKEDEKQYLENMFTRESIHIPPGKISTSTKVNLFLS